MARSIAFLLFFTVGLCATKAEEASPPPSLIDLDFDISGVSDKCAQHWKDFKRELNSKHDRAHWALKSKFLSSLISCLSCRYCNSVFTVYDAYGSQPMSGETNFWALGSPSSCYELSVDNPSGDLPEDHGSFQGKYCWVAQSVA